MLVNGDPTKSQSEAGIDGAYDGEDVEPSSNTSKSSDNEADSEMFKNTLTSEVQNHQFVFAVKTHSQCTYCKILHDNLEEFKSIFPSNVEVVFMILDTMPIAARETYFMNTRGGAAVPSMFITCRETWDRYLDGSLNDEDLYGDKVISLLGQMPLVYSKLRQLLSNSMHRLYLYENSADLIPAEHMIISDMDFPLVTFPLSLAEKERHANPRRNIEHGKAYYMSDKCSGRKCPDDAK